MQRNLMVSPFDFRSMGQRVKEIVIQELRNYFRDVSQFGTPMSTVKMPIIRESYGSDIRNYPAVFIKILSENPSPLGIGKNYVQDVFSDDQTIFQQYLPGTENFKHPIPYKPRVIAERWGYMSDISFQLQVWGDTTPIRNKMVDEIMAAFERYQRQSLMRQGIILVSISEGEESDYPLNDTEHVYIANINLTVNAELYFDVPCASITGVNVSISNNINKSPDQAPYIIEIDPT
jgi:hypothetical protein